MCEGVAGNPMFGPVPQLIAGIRGGGQRRRPLQQDDDKQPGASPFPKLSAFASQSGSQPTYQPISSPGGMPQAPAGTANTNMSAQDDQDPMQIFRKRSKSAFQQSPLQGFGYRPNQLNATDYGPGPLTGGPVGDYMKSLSSGWGY